MSVDHSETNFIADLVHDLKTPLAAAKGFVDLLHKAGDLNERQTYYIDRAQASMDRIEQIIIHLLDFARMESGMAIEMADCDLKQIIYETVHILEGKANERDITIQIDIDPALQPVKGDPRLLTHVVDNLIGNAIKYNQDSGRVWVTVSDEQTFVRVDVRDTGIGIPIEAQERIFERFYRARDTKSVHVEGNGLGLSIAHAIIERHNGRIWVNSEPGSGSVFSFTLPRSGTSEGVEIREGERQRRSSRSFGSFEHESSSEPMDDVDDNLQESREIREFDSRSDDM